MLCRPRRVELRQCTFGRRASLQDCFFAAGATARTYTARDGYTVSQCRAERLGALSANLAARQKVGRLWRSSNGKTVLRLCYESSHCRQATLFARCALPSVLNMRSAASGEDAISSRRVRMYTDAVKPLLWRFIALSAIGLRGKPSRLHVRAVRWTESGLRIPSFGMLRSALSWSASTRKSVAVKRRSATLGELEL